MNIQRINFEPPIPTNNPNQFEGFVCVAWTDAGISVSGCDYDSPEDAYAVAAKTAEHFDWGCILPHTVQMFRVGGA